MQHKHLRFGRGFRVALGDRRSQAAQMTLAAGEVEGGRTTATAAQTSGSTSSRERARPWSMAIDWICASTRCC